MTSTFCPSLLNKLSYFQFFSFENMQTGGSQLYQNWKPRQDFSRTFFENFQKKKFLKHVLVTAAVASAQLYKVTVVSGIHSSFIILFCTNAFLHFNALNSFFSFFSIKVFFHGYSQFTGQQGKVEEISLTPLSPSTCLRN